MLQRRCIWAKKYIASLRSILVFPQDHGLNGIRLALSPNSGASAPSVTGASFTPNPLTSQTVKKTNIL